MTNIIESIKNTVSNYTDDESKSPLHVGEVMSLWTYLATLEEANRFVEIGLNTTTDSELIQALKNSFDDCAGQISDITQLFKKEGIPFPPTSETKTPSNPSTVPLGVKMTDDEIANGLSLKLVAAITLCAAGLSQAIRSDIGAMWVKFLLKRTEFSAYFIPIMRKRGWVKIPPYYYPPGSPNHQ